MVFEFEARLLAGYQRRVVCCPVNATYRPPFAICHDLHRGLTPPRRVHADDGPQGDSNSTCATWFSKSESRACAALLTILQRSKSSFGPLQVLGTTNSQRSFPPSPDCSVVAYLLATVRPDPKERSTHLDVLSSIATTCCCSSVVRSAFPWENLNTLLP